MKNKFISSKKLGEVHLIFGNGVSSFFDRAKKILYSVQKSTLTSIRFFHYQIGIFKFPINESYWNDFKRSKIQKYAMAFLEPEKVEFYKFNIAFSFQFKKSAIMLIFLEDINRIHLSEYWETYMKRYCGPNKKEYFMIDYFKK